MQEKRAAVEVHALTVAYDTKPVLRDINLSIPAGRLAAIVGPNGAGKSTLIKAMLGLIKPLSGTVRFGEPDAQIAYVPQSESVDWDFPATVLDVVLMGRYGKLGWFKRPRRSDKAMALAALEKLGMQSFSSRQISMLSGGQQQRVFLARALVQEADIYLMDEPFKGVDAQTEKSIVELLRQLEREGKTVIVVHHDLHTVAEYFDWLTLINLELIANGALDEVLTEANLSAAYGGRGFAFKGAL